MTPSHHLKPGDLDRLWDFWSESFDDPPMTKSMLAERVFGAADFSPEHALVRFDGEDQETDRIIALCLIVPEVKVEPETGARIGGIRWFGVHPDRRGNGIASELLAESLDRLRSAGATHVDFLATPPFYIRPGVDVRQTDFIAWLLGKGFEHERTNFNMTVELACVDLPSVEQLCDAAYGSTAGAENTAGYRIRRATQADREAFGALCERHWTPNWRAEAWQGVGHDPCSLFVAEKEDVMVGFASYETSQGLGSFGPTGVAPEHRGRGLGARLLRVTLADMKRLGRARAEIGWVGPVDFYHRACGATLGPVYWQMRKKL